MDDVPGRAADQATGPARRMRRRVLLLMGLLACAVVFACWRTVAWPGSLLLATGFLVPLALPLPGILRSNRRTFAWATLCVTPYFVFGLTELIANPAVRTYAGAAVLASLALVAALIAYLRLTRPGNTPAPPQER